MRVCVRARARALVCARARVCEGVCVSVRVCVRTLECASVLRA